MYYKVFCQQTSVRSLDIAFYEAIHRKDKKEADLIFAEYKKALPIVLKREGEMAKQGWAQ